MLKFVANILLIILQKNSLFLFYVVFRKFQFEVRKNFIFQGKTISSAGVTILPYKGSHFLVFNKRLKARITIKTYEDLTLSQYVISSI